MNYIYIHEYIMCIAYMHAYERKRMCIYIYMHTCTYMLVSVFTCR